MKHTFKQVLTIPILLILILLTFLKILLSHTIKLVDFIATLLIDLIETIVQPIPTESNDLTIKID